MNPVTVSEISKGAEPGAGSDPMGDTAESLLRWMLEVAEARDSDPKARTVNLKFSANTLRMWRDRVRDLPEFSVRQRSLNVTNSKETGADSYRVTRVVEGKKVFEQFASRADLVAAMAAVGIATNGAQMPHEMVSPRLAGEPTFDNLAGPFLSRDGIRYEAWELQ